MALPEWEDDEACDYEDCSKYNEDVIAGISPPSIVEHLCRLEEEKEIINLESC